MKSQSLRISALFLSLLAAHPAQALDQIVRPFGTGRSYGMGGVRTTTGVYEDNFFGNPARVTANPKFRFTLLDPMFEGNGNISDTASKITGDGDILKKISSTAGENNHIRVQTSFPAIYFAPGDEGRWGVAFALLSQTQADVGLRQNYDFVPQATVDLGPALTVGRKFLEDKSLSVGATAHLVYRFQTTQSFSFLDFLKGSGFSTDQSAADGSMVDFDLGATYALPLLKESPFRLSVAGSINNLLGGGYSNLGVHLMDLKCTATGCKPAEQPRSLNVGISASRSEWWKLKNTLFAFELSDLGNNRYGNIFRLAHLGAETHWSVFALRAGLNQGYWTGGLGIDFRFLELDFNTYGEEMTFNPGGLEDRRYALKLSFHI